MRTLTLTFSLLSVLVSAKTHSSSENRQNLHESLVANDRIKKVKIKVKSVWMQNKKAKALQAEIKKLEGIEEVYVCPFRSKTIVKYHPEVLNVDQIEQVILGEGYGVN